MSAREQDYFTPASLHLDTCRKEKGNLRLSMINHASIGASTKCLHGTLEYNEEEEVARPGKCP
uniref:hypothetical protein n=1 Tax=Salmonella sp. s55004 TaxID=3159675 RepID=UPI00398162A1